MKNFVITVARGYGSGGKTIGKMLAEKLGVNYYNSKLLHMAAQESGISEALFTKSDEKLKGSVVFGSNKGVYTGGVIRAGSEDFTSVKNLFNYQALVISKLADRESCVIIGRAADYILRDRPNVLRLYVHAPFDYCVKSAMVTQPDLSEEQARRYIRRTDKNRAEYYRYFTGRHWKDADNYDLCLNSSDLGREKCMALVINYLEIKMGYGGQKSE